MRTVGFVLSVGFLLFIGGSGVQSFLSDWALVETPLQRAVNLGQLAFAITGLGAGVGAILKRPWTRKVALAFVWAVAFTAGTGPMAWGEAGVLMGLLDAGLGFLLGFVLYLGVRRVGETELVVEPAPAGVEPVETQDRPSIGSDG